LVECLDAIRADLKAMAAHNFGYPIGTNEVRHPCPTIPTQLFAFYQCCDGLSLPDVHIGYFIDLAERVITAQRRGEPPSPGAVHQGVFVENRQSRVRPLVTGIHEFLYRIRDDAWALVRAEGNHRYIAD
jgi:hypothetical protein